MLSSGGQLAVTRFVHTGLEPLDVIEKRLPQDVVLIVGRTHRCDAVVGHRWVCGQRGGGQHGDQGKPPGEAPGVGGCGGS